MTDDLDPKVALAEQFAECKRRRERDRERIAEVEAESALKLVAGVSAPGPVGVVLLGAGEQHRQQEAGGALAELQAKLAAAEAALAWYKNWAIVTVARERGGLWSNRDDKERAALKLEAEVDLERTRKTGGYR